MHSWQFNAVLFDLDGVLVDSTACVERHLRRWAERHGFNVEAILRHAHGTRTVDTIRRVAPHLNAEAEAAAFDAGEALDAEGVVANEGAAELIQALPPEAWAVVTSGARGTATARLTQAGLPLPELLVTADDVTNGKPDPEPYMQAANRMGLAPEQCLVIEDAPAGLAAARAAGMSVFAVTTTHVPSDLAEADTILSSLRDMTIRSIYDPASGRTKLCTTLP